MLKFSYCCIRRARWPVCPPPTTRALPVDERTRGRRTCTSLWSCTFYSHLRSISRTELHSRTLELSGAAISSPNSGPNAPVRMTSPVTRRNGIPFGPGNQDQGEKTRAKPGAPGSPRFTPRPRGPLPTQSHPFLFPDPCDTVLPSSQNGRKEG